MAKLAFSTDEGEKTYRLSQDRVLRIGRDPGNDIILRDAKVSRQHAEITFERGFFVLRDLSSSNGSFVNGKRIRVAPLTNGAEVRFGSSIGQFTEEIASLGSPQTAAAPLPQGEPPFETQEHPITSTSPGEGAAPDAAGGETSLEPKISPDELEKGQSDSPVPGDRRWNEPVYRFQIGRRLGEPTTIRSSTDEPLLYYVRPTDLVALVGAVVVAMIVIAGTGATALIASRSQLLLAIAAAGMTAVFAAAIALLVPRRQLLLFDDPELTSVALHLHQESRLPFPTVRFSARVEDGSVIAFFHKNHVRSIPRRTWWILDRVGLRRLGSASESSMLSAFVSRMSGGFVAALRSNFRIVYEGRLVGELMRRDRQTRTLDLTRDANRALDRRVSVALAALIDCFDAR